MAFGSCSRAQLALIFLNTLAFFIAGTLLGFGIYVYSYMRTTNAAIISVCLAASVATMIATGMGAWGALLKKHGVLKAYFYFLLLINLVLLVEGTLCIIYSNQVDEYVENNFQRILEAMPDSECYFAVNPYASIDANVKLNIALCKSNIKGTLKDNLQYVGGCCIAMAVIMIFGLIAAGRLLTWDRLTGPLLQGGASMMFLYAILSLILGIDLLVEEETASVRDRDYSGYIAIAAGVLLLFLSATGVFAMKQKSSLLLLVYQVLGILIFVILVILCGTAAHQSDSLKSWASDNFDQDKLIRPELHSCDCNNDDYPSGCGAPIVIGAVATTVPFCNARDLNGNLLYYTCVNGYCELDISNTLATTFCLKNSYCVDQVVNDSQAILAAIATSSGFFLVYLAICIAASFNARIKIQEEASTNAASSMHLTAEAGISAVEDCDDRL